MNGAVMLWEKKYMRLERKQDFLDSENFLDSVFGLGRHLRTLNFLRRNIYPDYNHSFHYRNQDDKLLGLIRFYKLILEDNTEASLMGPVAIHRDYQQQGLGNFLIHHGLASVDAEHSANHLIFLVGGYDYYQRHGFCSVKNHENTEQYSFDGPIAPLSLLVRCHDKQEILKHRGRLNFINRL